MYIAKQSTTVHLSELNSEPKESLGKVKYWKNIHGKASHQEHWINSGAVHILTMQVTESTGTMWWPLYINGKERV